MRDQILKLLSDCGSDTRNLVQVAQLIGGTDTCKIRDEGDMLAATLILREAYIAERQRELDLHEQTRIATELSRALGVAYETATKKLRELPNAI